MPRVVLSLLPLLVGFDLFARMAFGAVFEATEPGHWFDTPSPTWFGIELGLVLVLWIAAQWKAPIAGAARSRGTTRRTTRVVMVVILGVHAGLATAYSWKLPLFEGTDETSHFDYARSIAAEGRLPSLALDDEDVTDLVIDQKIQPPGYYLMMAPLMASAGTTSWSTFYVSAVRDRHHWNAANWVHGIDELGPYTGDVLTFHRLRLTGLLFSCLALLGLHRALRQARLRRGNALAVTAFAAFLPQFVHIAGILSNDLPTLALGPWIIALTLRCVRRGGSSARSSFGLGALLGVALISKLSAFVFLPWLLLCGLQVTMNTRSIPWKSTVLVVAGLVLLSGWYWVYQHVQYGNALQNWVYQNAYQKTAADQAAPGLVDPWFKWAGVFVSTFAVSFFCDLGWMKAWPRNPALIALAVCLFLWWIPLLTRTGWNVLRERARGARFAALALFVLAWVAQVRFNASIFQPMGRHHYPFLAVYLIGFALALEAGSRLLSRFRKGFGHVPRIALVVLSLAFSLYAYRFVLVEQFHPLNAQHDPRFRITDEALRHAATNVRLIAPAPGAEVHGTPTFHWEAEPDRTYGLELHHDPSFVSHADYRMSQRILRTFEQQFQHRLAPQPLQAVTLQGGTFTLPQSIWANLETLLPTGSTVYWRIRTLPRTADEPIVVSEPRAFVRR